ncbi:MAG: type II toxin-antitoxin system HipA family toxin [Pasteurella sp.]|nr:type II toxin-antitoxin system HipA family toxin [Pasteurella sp.]
MNTLPQQIQQLYVSVENTDIGTLTHAATHYYQPTQTEISPSLTMKRNSLQGFESGALHPIFAQNLPEGFTRRFIAERLARYAKVNDMYLLALSGKYGIGMLSYHSDFTLPEPESVTLDSILHYQGSEPLFPQLLEKYYLRNALSGVQPKVSVPNINRTLEQKDLIVKSFDEEFPLLTVNEYVCMQCADYCGLNPPTSYLSDNFETFVIERFDRYDGISDTPQCLGFEDFTTLLKKPNNPNAKYLGSYETLLKATYLYTQSLQAVETMYRYIVFNCLIGNGDAHLKNFALQYTPDHSRIFVSPPFDITHTLIYDTIDDKMALKMAGSKFFPDKKTLIALATSPEFHIRKAQHIIEEIAQNIRDYINQSDEVLLFKGLKQSILASVDNAMSEHYSPKNYRHDKKRKYE